MTEEQDDRTPGLVSHSGGRMSEEELLARGERREATPVDDESVMTSAGLPPRGSAELEDPRYAEITVISSTGGFPS